MTIRVRDLLAQHRGVRQEIKMAGPMPWERPYLQGLADGLAHILVHARIERGRYYRHIHMV